MEQILTVYGSELKVGDIMRFRMSKHDPVRWLRVLGITPTASGKRLYVGLDSGCAEIVSKREKVQIQRAAEAAASLGPCRWFLHCSNPATMMRTHPILGEVPVCDRCNAR